jgi:hypothetical protein
VAVLHGLGTGTDASAVWLQALTAVCAAAVAVSLSLRLVRRGPARTALRAGALGAVAAMLATGVAFAALGPLRPGWARRAGTPAALLAATHPLDARTGPASRAATRARAAITVPFLAPLDGRIHQLRTPGGAEIDILSRVAVPGAPLHLDLRLVGQALPDGGLRMSSSDVRLRRDGAVRSYRGRVVALAGGNLEARLARPGARPILLRLALQIDPSGAVGGTAGAQELPR